MADAGDIRQRLFTLFVNAYDQARRAVGYLRWNEGDADQIAPSLYAGRSNGRRKADQPDPPTPAAGNAEPGASAAQAHDSPIAVGLPGASPYVQ